MPSAVLAIEGDTTAGVEQGVVPGETTTDVAALGLAFEIETPSVYLNEPKLARLLVVEANTGGQALTAAIIADGTTNTLTSTISTAAKARVEIPIAITGTIFAVRLSRATLTSRIEISAIELDFPNTGIDNPA
jgi:hypothetical protein